MLQKYLTFCLFSLLTLLSAQTASAEVKIVTSIKPLHSLASVVTKGVSEPSLIIDGPNSPHDFQLRPSKARLIQNADLVLWVGEGLETFLVKPLANLRDGQTLVTAMELENIKTLAQRDHLELSGHDHDHDETNTDPHLWLDPTNAIVIVDALAKELAQKDPANAVHYANNAKAFAGKMQGLSTEIQALIDPVKTTPFFVFHDAFHYFEDRFDISAQQAVTPSIEQRPGARRIRQLRADIRSQSIRCVFVEPQTSIRIIEMAAAGSNAKIAELDVLGVNLEAGADLYRQLLLKMARVMNACLSTP